MASDLSPSEKEDQEITRLMPSGRKQPHNRKYKNKRSPRSDLRRRRMKIDDPDFDQSGHDLSLNYKIQGSTKPISQNFELLYNFIHKYSAKLADQLNSVIIEEFKDKSYNYEQVLDDIYTKIKSEFGKLVKRFSKSKPEQIISTIKEIWSGSSLSSYIKKIAVLVALDELSNYFGLPKSIKSYFLNSQLELILTNQELIKQMIEEEDQIKPEKIITFATLVSLNRILKENPFATDFESVAEKIKELSELVSSQLLEINEVDQITNRLDSILTKNKKEETSETVETIDESLHNIKKFMNKSTHVDPSESIQAMYEYLKDKHQKIPEELQDIFDSFLSSSEASYKLSKIKIMADRIATYHGVIDRGHPTNTTNTDWLSLDKRDLDKRHYDSIIKNAKELLSSDWFKYGWEGGSEDAPIRAALDISIYTADSNLYQSKIDGESYNYLLNKLANYGYDTFSDTVLPMKAPKDRSQRSASVSQPIDQLVLIADSLRKSQPKLAFQMLDNIRRLSADLGPTEPLEFSEKEIDELLANFKDELADNPSLNQISQFIKEALEEVVKTKSVKASHLNVIPLIYLVRIAKEIPSTRSILIPILAAAKKKKAPKKSEKSEKSEKPSAKKAPGKELKIKEDDKTTSSKKSKSKGKKRQSFTSSDLDW